MIDVYHLDYETRSAADIKKCGAYKYAEHPTTRVLMAGISKNDGPVYLWVNPFFSTPTLQSDYEALQLLQEGTADPTAEWWAHNAEFERAVSRCRMFEDIGVLTPRPDQWRCTAAIARRAALPASLEKVGAILQLTEQKDARGKKLINFFCIPRKRDGGFNQPQDHPAEFAEFGAYCKQDVRTEKATKVKLKAFHMKDAVLRTFQLDAKINDRGLPVNVPALKVAQAILEDIWAEYEAKFNKLTGLNYTQKQAVKKLLQGYGVDIDDMKGETLKTAIEAQTNLMLGAQIDGDTVMEDIYANSLEVLMCYAALNYAACKKVIAMLNCVCSDGRVRGTLLYHGAGTGRWSARLIQPQNFKKPTIKETGLAYQMICDGCTRAELELVFGNPLEVIASCIRHFIHWPGGDMFDADYSAIEARIVCWLAGQEDVLEDFRQGIDVYKKMAGTIWNRPWTEIENPSHERTVGKHTVLGCGFGMWWPKFIETCAKFGVTVDDELAERAVRAYRERHDKVEKLWSSVEAAAKASITYPGKIFKAGPFLRFCVVNSEGIPFLVMQLPSGRNIVYPWPKIEPTKYRSKIRIKNKVTGEVREVLGEEQTRMSITFYGQLEGKQIWGRVKTYGASLTENATQGVAADVMANGGNVAEDDGFEIFMLVHDQAIGPAIEGRTIEEFCDRLTAMPAWANGLPIKADGKVVPYYTKN